MSNTREPEGRTESSFDGQAFRTDAAPASPEPAAQVNGAATAAAAATGTIGASEYGSDDDIDLETLAQNFVAASDDKAGERDALDALLTDDGAREVEAPAPETLTSVMPPLEEIPDTPIAVQDDADPDDTAALEPLADEQASSQDEFVTYAFTATGSAAAKARPTADWEERLYTAGTQPGSRPDSSGLDALEATAIAQESTSPSQTAPFTAVDIAEARAHMQTSERVSGSARGTGALSWGSRTDVGRIRDHNEDSFVIQFPLFAVADGMGGHAAGEIASTIAVSALATAAPESPDQTALANAVEQANIAVMQAAANGLGRPGMGTTCTAVLIEGGVMAVGHVGDSRCYLLHAGQLVRVTHDHSYVEELVAAGQITPEEARVHPNRSVITRALGSDPDMKADGFLIEVARGDRVLLCSDGLNSMIDDAAIEEAMVCSPTPQACADALVDLALDAGGYDNVTCVVVDVKDDGTAAHALKVRLRNIAIAILAAVAVLLAVALGMFGISQRRWFLTDQNGYVALYRGIPGNWGVLPFNEFVEGTSVDVTKLSDAVETRLQSGISFDSEQEARDTIDQYRAQIAEAEQGKAAESERINSARVAAGTAEEQQPADTAATMTAGTGARASEEASSESATSSGTGAGSGSAAQGSSSGGSSATSSTDKTASGQTSSGSAGSTSGAAAGASSSGESSTQTTVTDEVALTEQAATSDVAPAEGAAEGADASLEAPVEGADGAEAPDEPPSEEPGPGEEGVPA